MVTAEKSLKTYTTTRGGESLYDIARKLGMPSSELMEHNDIPQETQIIPEDTVLRLPYDRPTSALKPIAYDLYDQPRKMHVIITEGVKKFSFANVAKPEDLTVTGPTYPFNSNIEVVAEAHVQVLDQGELKTYIYLMDGLSLGNDIAETGRPAFTIGFNHSQLADGFVDVTKAPIPLARQKRLKVLIQSDKDSPSPDLAALPTTELDYQVVDDVEEWRKWMSTYVAYDEPVLYTADEEMWVKDFMGRRPDKLLKSKQEVVIAGTFIVDNTEYARPLQAAKNFLWYGVPKDNLISDEELYNTHIPLHERVALPHGRLSLNEKYVVVPLAKVVSLTSRLKTILGKNKNNNKEIQ